MLRLTLTVAFFQLFLMAPAFAQYTSGQACGGAGEPEAGSFHTKNDATTKTVTQMMCNGTTWENVGTYAPVPSIMFRQYSHGLVDVARGTASNHTALTAKGNAYQGDVFIGYLAGRNASTSDGQNVIIGARAGSSHTTASYNTLIGANSGEAITTGSGNVLVGHDSRSSAGATGNVVLGPNAGSTSIGNGNIILGSGSGAGSNVGSRNIVIGSVVTVVGGLPLNDNLNIGNTIFGNLAGAATNDTGTARIGINKRAPSVALDVIGDINFTGVMNDVSDIRQKEDIRSLANVLERLHSVHGVSFVMKNDPTRTREIGLIAQDVEKVFPGLVKTYNGVKSLNYQGMIGPLVEAVKELDTRNQTLNAENAELKQMIHALSARMDVIEGKARPRLSPLNR